MNTRTAIVLAGIAATTLSIGAGVAGASEAPCKLGCHQPRPTGTVQLPPPTAAPTTTLVTDECPAFSAASC